MARCGPWARGRHGRREGRWLGGWLQDHTFRFGGAGRGRRERECGLGYLPGCERNVCGHFIAAPWLLHARGFVGDAWRRRDLARRSIGVHRHHDASPLLGALDRHHSPERQRAQPAVGVDPERVGAQRDGERAFSAAFEHSSRRSGGQARDELRMVGMEVVEGYPQTLAEGAHLLIARRGVEEREVHALRQRPLAEIAERPSGACRPDPVTPLWPRRRDGPKANRLECVLQRGAWPLEVWEHHAPVRVASLSPHAHRVRRAGAAPGALVDERHLSEGLPLAHRAVRAHGAIGDGLDRLHHLAHREARVQRPRRAPIRCKSATHEDHVGAGLDWHQVARGAQATRRVVAPVAILVRRGLLCGRQRAFAGAEDIGRLADHREHPRARARLPHKRRNREGARGDDVHVWVDAITARAGDRSRLSWTPQHSAAASGTSPAALFSSTLLRASLGVSNGVRTRDNWNHNPT